MGLSFPGGRFGGVGSVSAIVLLKKILQVDPTFSICEDKHI